MCVKHARRGATGGSVVREGADPRNGGRFVLRTLEGSAFHERGVRTAAARRGDRVERILSNNPSRRVTREAGEVDAMTQIRTSESGTLVRHGLRRHRRVHPHTRVHAYAGAFLATAAPSPPSPLPIRAYVRVHARVLRVCICFRTRVP